MGITVLTIAERKEREKAERRQEILKAAKAVFFRNGFEHTSMEMIATESQLAKGTLYLYFKSKEELYVSLVEEGIALMSEMMNDAVEKCNTVEEKLMATVEAYYDFTVKHHDYMQIFMAVNIGALDQKVDAEKLEQIQHCKWAEFLRSQALVEEGMRQGIFSPTLDSREAVMLMWASVYGGIMMTTKMCNHLPMFREVDSKKFVMEIARRLHESYKTDAQKQPEKSVAQSAPVAETPLSLAQKKRVQIKSKPVDAKESNAKTTDAKLSELKTSKLNFNA